MSGDWAVLVNNNGAVSSVRFHTKDAAEAARMWLRDKLDDVIIIHDPDPHAVAWRIDFAAFRGER